MQADRTDRQPVHSHTETESTYIEIGQTQQKLNMIWDEGGGGGKRGGGENMRLCMGLCTNCCGNQLLLRNIMRACDVTCLNVNYLYLELPVLFCVAFFFFLLYPSSVLVCLCFPDEDILVSKLSILRLVFFCSSSSIGEYTFS